MIHYLHSLQPKLIHGDIRGVNILINDELRPVVAEFGLASVADSQATTGNASASGTRGSLRWMAPELFDPPVIENVTYRRGPASDVYAFACLVHEIYTGRPPFSREYGDAAVMFQVMKGNRPQYPVEGVLLPLHVWHLMRICWAQSPPDRPDMAKVIQKLEEMPGTPDLARTDDTSKTVLWAQHERKPTLLRFINQRTEPVHLYRLDHEGSLKSFGAIPPGRFMVRDTFVTHPWVATDAVSGEGLGRWYPEETFSLVPTKWRSLCVLTLIDNK